MKIQHIYSKDFKLVIIGQITSLFGNQILRYALPLYLLNETGSSTLFGTILACSFIPMLLLYPIGGIIADRVNKRNIMVVLDFCTAGLILMFYLLVGHINIVILMGVSLMILYGIQGAYQPAVQASVPVLIDKEHIVQGNSIVNLISSLAGMIGPIIGGILLSTVGLTPILYVSMICFALAAIMELFIYIPFQKQVASGNIIQIGLSDLKDSLGFIFKEKPVLWKMSFTYASVNLLLTSLILIGLPVLITQNLGFQADTANRLYGYAQGGIAAGAILGGVLAGVSSKRVNAKKSPLILLGCAITMLIAGIALQSSNHAMLTYIVLVLCASILLILSTLFQIQIMSFLQMLTPKGMIGKAISCVICICMCTNPLGQALYGIIFDSIGSYTFLPFYTASFIMIGIAFYTRSFFSQVDALITV